MLSLALFILSCNDDVVVPSPSILTIFTCCIPLNAVQTFSLFFPQVTGDARGDFKNGVFGLLVSGLEILVIAIGLSFIDFCIIGRNGFRALAIFFAPQLVSSCFFAFVFFGFFLVLVLLKKPFLNPEKEFYFLFSFFERFDFEFGEVFLSFCNEVPFPFM